MVMGMPWILWIASILCCIDVFRCDESSQKKPQPTDEESFKQPEAIFESLFGFRPCLDESCFERQPPVPAGGEAIGKSPTGGDYKVGKIPLDKMPAQIAQPLCAYVNPAAVKDFRKIESRHPDFSEVRDRIVEEIISYAFPLSTFHAENCSVEMQLLDLIIVAATELREEYLQLRGGNCTYLDEEESESPVAPPVSSTTPPPVYKREVQPRPFKMSPPLKSPEVSFMLTTQKPSEKSEEDEEVIAEDEEHAPLVGSVRGIPGVHYPNYTDVPITSFSCADKHVPGFYADLETGCQVFHVCYEHRRESFLCPIGTTFNQPILACDYWYSSNCSLAPAYFKHGFPSGPEDTRVKDDIIKILPDTDGGKPITEEGLLDKIVKFFPVKAKISEYPVAPKGKKDAEQPAVQNVANIASDIFDKIIITSTDVASKTRSVIQELPEPSELGPKVTPDFIQVPKAKAAAKLAVKSVKPIFAKGKIAAATLPFVAAKAAVPVAKLTAGKAAIPVAKVVAAKTAIPIAKVVSTKAAKPALAKAKLAAVPAAKVVAAKTKLAVPAMKAKALKAAGIPLVKAKVLAVPLVKSKLAAPLATAKLAKAAAISPMTKKALALGYMKLLKAKKLALMG